MRLGNAAAMLAELRGVSAETIARQTSENFARVFTRCAPTLSR